MEGQEHEGPPPKQKNIFDVLGIGRGTGGRIDEAALQSGDKTGGHAQHPKAVNKLGAVCEDGESIPYSRTGHSLAEVERGDHQAEQSARRDQFAHNPAVVLAESAHGHPQESHGRAKAEGHGGGVVHRPGALGVPKMVTDQSNSGAGYEQEPDAGFSHHEADRGPQDHGNVRDRISFSFQATTDTQHARCHGCPTVGREFQETGSRPVLRQAGATDGAGVLAARGTADSQGRIQEVSSSSEAGRAHSVRTLILRNSANYCYANAAIRTLLWAVASDSHMETTLTNIGRNFVRGLLGHKGRSILVAGHILFSAIFRGWRSPSRQHDCAEFFTHMIMQTGPDLCHGRWEARCQQDSPRNGSSVVKLDEGLCQQAISLELPDGDLHQTQYLLHNWHQQAHIHALVQAPTILVLSFSRYGGPLGQGRKNTCRVAWREVVHMPIFTADNVLTTRVVEYDTIAVVMRHGDSVDSGHYTARLIEAEGYLLCDDNAAPIYQASSQDAETCQSRDVYMLVCKLRGRPPQEGGGISNH